MIHKRKKIKNKYYREFLDSGMIQYVNEDHIKRALENVTGRFKTQGRAMLICMYYTGARPNEVLRLESGDVDREKGYITIRMKGSKGGLPRVIRLPFKKEMVKEFYKYASSLPPHYLLFYMYHSRYRRMRMTKGGELRESKEISNKLRYYFNKWFDNVMLIPPYFLRHNRFSKLSEAGVSLQNIRQLKGSKTYESIMPYLHMSTEASKQAAKKMD